jgi:hypothetical protein
VLLAQIDDNRGKVGCKVVPYQNLDLLRRDVPLDIWKENLLNKISS